MQEHNFVTGVYNSEIRRFGRSFKAKVYAKNKSKHDDALTLRLEELVNDKYEYLTFDPARSTWPSATGSYYPR